MSTSFYGNIIRGKFPLKSKIRLEDDSVGARMLNAIGSEIENTYRRKVLSHNTCSYISTPTALNNLETLYRYDLIKDDSYRSSVMLERVDEITIGEKVNVKSLEELYNSPASEYKLGNTIATDDPLLFTLSNDPSNDGKEVFEVKKVEKESYIYVNVKQVSKTEDESKPVSSGICIRGKDKNLNPIEETIQIDSERMYVTKQKFFTLEPLAQNTKHNISGGASVSVSDFKEFNIEILKYPCKTWLVNQVDSRDLEPAKTKRIQIDNFISKPKRDEIILEGAVGDNTLVVELVEVESENETSTKLKYIHRYFNDLNAYRNELNPTDNPYDVEEHIFEAVLGEVALADSSGARIEAIDFDYNIVDGHLYVLGEDKSIYVYEIGNKEAGTNKVPRTYNPGIRIDVLEEMLLPDEEVTVRLINTSLDFPLNSFIVGKVQTVEGQEELQFQFLNADKVFNDTTISVFNPLSSGVDLQDSLELFSFNTAVNSDIELFVICFAGTAANRKVINDYNNEPDRFTLQIFLNAIDAKQINTKKLICNLIEPKKTYSPITDNFEIKHLYFKGTDRSLWVVDDGDTHHQFKPEYDEFYFANNAIFKTKEATGAEAYTFKLLNGETVGVTING